MPYNLEADADRSAPHTWTECSSVASKLFPHANTVPDFTAEQLTLAHHAHECSWPAASEIREFTDTR